MRLTDRLKEDHAKIIALLGKAKELGVISKEGKDLLLSIKQELLNHMATEDRELYPVLRTAQARNEKVAETMDKFTRDLQEITKVALEFFDKYTSQSTGHDFARDCGKLYATLNFRITNEEKVLYKEFDKLVP